MKEREELELQGSISDSNVTIASLASPEPMSLSLVIEGNEILTFKKDGLYYKGRLLEIDKEIEDAFRDYLVKAGGL